MTIDPIYLLGAILAITYSLVKIEVDIHHIKLKIKKLSDKMDNLNG